MEKEIQYLGDSLGSPAHPFVLILGGAKVSDKIKVIEYLLPQCDCLLIGGGMAYTFYVAKGIPVGNSLVEAEKVTLAKETMELLEANGVKLLLPVDHVVADAFSADANVQTVDEDGIADGWMALDVGPKTCELFAAELANAKTVVWNGPMGYFEAKPFAAGTAAVARALAKATATGATTIIGGGDSAAAVEEAGFADKVTHVSTGGGASLDLLGGKALPGVTALEEAAYQAA